MLSLTTFSLLIVIGFISIIWQSNMRCRELALKTMQHACQERNLQLLDDTITFKYFKIVRMATFQFALLRTYTFEYYDGQLRLSGQIKLLNGRIQDIHFADITELSEAVNENFFNPPNHSNIILFPHTRHL